MSELPFASDNESIQSPSTTFSTAYQSIHPHPRPLRRKNTVTQLTRWVSKRISRSSPTDNVGGNELSEQNLKELNKAINTEAESHALGETNTDSDIASFVKERKATFATISEIEVEQSPKSHLERERELRVRRSYAAFCEDFTLSGSSGPKRIFHMTMGMDDCAEEEDQQTRSPHTNSILESQPSSGEALPLEHDQLRNGNPFQLSTKAPEHECLEPVSPHGEKISETMDLQQKAADDENNNWKSQTPPTHYPYPPSAIMTPAVYEEMQRATRERKRARKQKLLGPFRELFLKVQPLRTQV